jgi:hypothetical protein
MKKTLSLLLIACAIFSCNKPCNKPGGECTLQNTRFEDSGCAKNAGVKSTYGDKPSTITLKYEKGGLRVIINNFLMNCSITHGGIGCEVTMDGNIITYYVFENDGPTVNCCCPVETITSVVEGLEEGKHYALKFSGYSAIDFTFEKGLISITDLDSLDILDF